MTIPLETDRLLLRYPNQDDAEFYSNLENNPRVKTFVGGPSGHNADHYRMTGILAQREKSPSTLTVIRRDTDTIIGRAGILEANDQEMELHCVIAEEFWKQGFGPEIITSLIGLCKQLYPDKLIMGKVHPHNKRSIHILEKLDFREIGTISSEGFDDGFMKYSLGRRTNK